METTTLNLFIYGTLLNADNEYGRYLKTYSVYISPGHFPGFLYDLGEYPGAVYTPDTESKVYGDIIMLDNSEVLKRLDDYEGYGDDEEQPNLYIRKMIAIQTDDGPVDCWVYLYNRSLAGYPLISSGRYT